MSFYRSRECTYLIKNEQQISDFSVKAEALSVYTPILKNGCNSYYAEFSKCIIFL